MNPVLQELFSQLNQRQIGFSEFKADLQGLCKMSPGMIAAACQMLEAAAIKNQVPADEAHKLIKLLDPAQQHVAATRLRRDAPALTTANDATVIMAKPAATSVADATVVINKPAVQIDATVVIGKAAAVVTEPTRIADSNPDLLVPDGTMQRQPVADRADMLQNIEHIDVFGAPEVAEKTQRIDRSGDAAAVEKTQRIEPGVNPAGADKTQRIARPNESVSTPRPTLQGQSHLGTVERFLTDGPLPPTVDMGAVSFGPGTIIKERFLLKEQIGSGGMGVVYAAIDRRKTEARDPNPLVALKILGADFARHPKSLIALQREARKAQELAHPNVVTVFDFDREGDAVYMTMELLQGRSLDGFVREVRGKGVSREIAWPIIRGIADGLAYAHRKGLVHSDMKPANIFLVEDNVPKLLDFGIARAVPSRVSKQVVKDIFDAGSLGAYTVPYATEEMVAGIEPHPADDIYALGLIAYELLAGAHPYKRQGAAEARKLGMKPVQIKGLSRREWKTIERSISFNRADRPQDATEFLKSLSGITKLQQVLIAASMIFLITAGYFAYTSYREAGPEIPFSSLPVPTQQQFNAYMADGDKLWNFYATDKNILALQEAVEQYAAAYDLHPRNRDAVKALQKAADAALDATKDNPDQQREFARSLIERSDYLAKDYSPMRRFVE